MRCVLVALVVATLLFFAPAPRAQAPADRADVAAIGAAIERALAVAPRGFQALQSPSQAGVRLLGVDVQQTSSTARRITIDLSQKTLTYDPSGDVEALLDHVLRSTAALTGGEREVEYRFLVDGLPLEQFISRIPPRADVRPQALGNGSRVLVSAGHGWYWNADYRTWSLQRDYYWNIVEDVVNWEIATYAWEELRAADLDARPARRPDRAAVAGASGYPAWQESAKYFLKALGAPSSVWEVGVNDYNQDINSRPLYSNWIDAAVMISIHNNGGGGTGTETWYDETNGQQADSRRLAQIINDRVVGAIRARYNAQWPDRGLRSCNGCKGENRLAARPAVILEVAFMDTRTPDNAALHDDTFKRTVARAIREAVQEWGQPGS